MIRIGRLTDYGMIILAYMARTPDRLFQARSIAEQTTIASPTVAKLLKKFAKSNLLTSHRGTHGGYRLSLDPKNITIAELIQVLEGPIALTDCGLGQNLCPKEGSCSLKSPWLKINRILSEALSAITLADLVTEPVISDSHDKQDTLVFIGDRHVPVS